MNMPHTQHEENEDTWQPIVILIFCRFYGCTQNRPIETFTLVCDVQTLEALGQSTACLKNYVNGCFAPQFIQQKMCACCSQVTFPSRI